MPQTKAVLQRKTRNINFDSYPFFVEQFLNFGYYSFLQDNSLEKTKGIAQPRAVLRRRPAKINFDYYSFFAEQDLNFDYYSFL